MLKHDKFYEKKEIVNYFDKFSSILPAESYFIMKNKNWLKNCIMLDIGVGAGRTTNFFSPLVKKYYGLDLSHNMIELCNQKFSEFKDDLNFIIGNALNLPFDDKSFDFVLFSYNGIDDLMPEDRIKCLKEIKRVLKDNGKFFFSSFNLSSIDTLYKIKHFYKNPIKMYKEIKRIINVIRVHGPLKKIKTMFTGGNIIDFKDITLSNLRHHYIRPDFQFKQLEDIGFKDFNVYSFQYMKVLDVNKILDSKEMCFCYSCTN